MAVWGRTRCLLITEAPHKIEYIYVWAEKKHFASLKVEGQSGIRTRDLRLSKQAALTTAPWPSPWQRSKQIEYSAARMFCSIFPITLSLVWTNDFDQTVL